MANTKSTQKPEGNTDATTDRYRHSSTCALDMLINAAPKNTVIKASNMMDGGNTASYLLRGLSYITALLANQEEVDHHSGNHCALTTVAELTELVSRFIEMNTEADCNQALLAQDEYWAFLDAVKKAQEVAS